MENYINSVLRPKIQGDGGEITFLKQEGNEVTVVFQGECSKCHILDRCIAWVQEQIEIDLGEKVIIKGIRKKPYFQDI
ncbi:MAG: NifU family protein [Clostridia bacterium]|nr:NifU family protein [Clostridia bacterium]